MASFLKRLGSLLPKRTRQGFAGYDIEGNSYFEVPSPAGGRPKRTVEYKVNRDLAEYTSGQHRLPVQWTTWLSHTRTDPPTLQELQSDSNRQSRLRPMIAAIEAREEAERIRQGYLPAPGSGTGSAGLVEGYAHASMPRSISGPASGMVSGAGAGPSRINTKPSFTTPASLSGSQSQYQPTETKSGKDQTYTRVVAGAGTGTSGSSTHIPTPTSNVPPPPPTVDPLKHDDPTELRRLAEEDTKRRIEERGGEADLREIGGPTGREGGGGALTPRRRGKR